MKNLNVCDECMEEKKTSGAVFNNVFGRYCQECLNATKRLNHIGKASYDRDRDREDHRRDLLQPWLPNGEPNPEFIREYPEESKGNFTEEELKEYS